MGQKINLTLIMLLILFASCQKKEIVRQISIPEENPLADSYCKKIDELPRYYPDLISSFQVDLRCRDLREFDLSDRIYDLEHSFYDNFTKWPDMSEIEYKPHNILNINADPGMKIREIHKKGITGKGIAIAIIDQNINLEHDEFKSRIRHLESFPQDTEHSSLHGPAVISIAIGENVGVAPEAEVAYFAITQVVNGNGELTCEYEVEAMKALIEYMNEGHQVSALSISSGANPSKEFYQEYLRYRNIISEMGVAIFSIDMFLHNSENFVYGLRKEPDHDPNRINNYKPIPWNDWILKIHNYPEIQTEYEYYLEHNPKSQYPVLLPLDGSTTYAGPISNDNYCFKFVNGWSWLPPYMAGLYALCCQIKEDLEADAFWSYLYETGIPYDFQVKNKVMHGRIINIEGLIERVEMSV